MMNRRDKLATSNPLARPSLDDLTDAMIAPDKGTLRVGSYTLTPTGLIGHSINRDEWVAVGDLLRRLEGGIQWMLADWLIEGEREYGQTYQMVADVTGYEYGYLRNLVYVAGKLSLRSDKLTFAHHQLVAALSPDDQRGWLEWAEQNQASIAQMRKAMKEAMRGEQPAEDLYRGIHEIQKQAVKWSGEIAKLAQQNIEQMGARDKQKLRDKAEWLSDYYRKIAERAK